MTDHREVTQWLIKLSMITGSADPISLDRIKVMTSMLADQYPDAAYSRGAMEFVASQSPFWPTYSELLTRLGDWWRENKPPEALQISDSRRAGLDTNDLQWISYYGLRVAEGFAGSPPQAAQDPEGHVLDLIRQQSPKAWEHITGQKRPGRDATRDRPMMQAAE